MTMHVPARSALVALSIALGLSSCGPRALPPPPKHDAPPSSTDDGRSSPIATPIRYELRLDVDPAKERFSGKVRIRVDLRQSGRQIVLHGAGLDVKRAVVELEGTRLPLQITTRPAQDELVFSSPRRLPWGVAVLEIDYEAPFAEGHAGLFRIREPSGDFAFTQFEPSDARRAFPCFDEPLFKVPFDVAITVPKGSIALSNGRVASRETLPGELRERFVFETTPNLPTYLVALAVGPLQVAADPEGKTPIRIVTTRQKDARLTQATLDTATASLAWLEVYFGQKYPYTKLDLVAIPGLSAYAMEHPGLVTFREDLVLIDPSTSSTSARRAMRSVVAHELAHQWFGNQTTLAYWNDLWLHEGLATWMATKATDMLAKDGLSAVFAVQQKHRAMEIDELPHARPLRPSMAITGDELFDELTYDKGAAVATAVEANLGAHEMQRVVASLFTRSNEHIFTEQFFRGTGGASLDVGSAPTTEVHGVRPGLVAKASVPLVQAKLTCAEGAMPRVDLAVAAPSFAMPVCVAYERGSGSACVELLDRYALDLPTTTCPKWIYPNAGEQGYYRFTIASPGMPTLLTHAAELPPAERVGLVANARALVRAGSLGAASLVHLAGTLRYEKHPAVLDELAKTLRFLLRMLPDEPSRASLRRFVASTFSPLATDLGWETGAKDPDAKRLARASALDLIGSIGEDAWAVEQAEARASAFLEGLAERDPDTTPVALRIAARRADEARFSALARALDRAETGEERLGVARALGAIADPSLLHRALDLGLTGELQRYELVAAFQEAALDPKTLPHALAWFESRVSRHPRALDGTHLVELADLVGETCDPATRDRALRTFSSSFQAQEMAQGRLVMQSELADACIAVRSRDAVSLRKLFGLP